MEYRIEMATEQNIEEILNIYHSLIGKMDVLGILIILILMMWKMILIKNHYT